MFSVVKKRYIVIAVTFAIIISVVFGTGASSVFYGGQLKKLPIYSVKTEEKKVAISFDCAWGTEYTDRLLEIMDNHNVKSTFFSVQFWTEKNADYVKKISEKGHDIGTHSATHSHMSKLDKTAMISELKTSKKAIEDITGKKVSLFRAPFGEYNDLLLETAEELDLFTIQWDVDSLDWKDLSKWQIYERVTKRVKNGSIVLFHNNGLHTADALEDIIIELRKRGFSFVKINDLIYKENYTIDVNGQQIKK